MYFDILFFEDFITVRFLFFYNSTKFLDAIASLVVGMSVSEKHFQIKLMESPKTETHTKLRHFGILGHR